MLLGLDAESRELADPVVLDGTQKLLRVVDIQFMVKRCNAFGTQAGYVQQLGYAGTAFPAQFFQSLAMAGCDDLLHLLGQGLADTGQLFQVIATRNEGADILAEPLNGARGIVIGAHPKRIGILYFEQLCYLLKDSGNISIVNRHDRVTGDTLLIIAEWWGRFTLIL